MHVGIVLRGHVESMTTFRQQDSRNHEELTRAIRTDVYGAHPELSIEQIAAGLNRGADDPQAVSTDTLQAVLIGSRKLPLHKVGRLRQVIESATHRKATATIQALCRQSGGIFVDLTHRPESATLRDAIREAAHFADASLAAIDDGTITPDEYEAVEHEAMAACAAILGHMHALKLRVKAVANA